MMERGHNVAPEAPSPAQGAPKSTAADRGAASGLDAGGAPLGATPPSEAMLGDFTAPANEKPDRGSMAIKAGGLYDQAIKAAVAEGKSLPAPADPAKGYTNGEALKMAEAKQITLPEKEQKASPAIKEGGKYDAAIKEAIAAGKPIPAPADPEKGYTKREVKEMRAQGLITMPEMEKPEKKASPAVKEGGIYDKAIKEAIAAGKPVPAPADPEKGYTKSEVRKMTKEGLITLPAMEKKEPKEKAPRDPAAGIKEGGVYDKAIKAAVAAGKTLPPPADPAKGYTKAEAAQMSKDKLISLPEKEKK